MHNYNLLKYKAIKHKVLIIFGFSPYFPLKVNSQKIIEVLCSLEAAVTKNII